MPSGKRQQGRWRGPAGIRSGEPAVLRTHPSPSPRPLPGPGRAAMQAAGDVPSPLLLELRPQAWGAGLELRHARKRHGGTHHRFSNKGGPYRSRVESFTGRKRCLSCDLVLRSQTKPCDQLAHRQAHDEHRDTDLTRQGGFLMVLVYYIYSTLLDTLPQGDRPFYQLNVSSVIS